MKDDKPTPKFTKQQLLFKKYDARTIKFEDIEAFCEAEGVDFQPDTSMKIAETMIALAKVVRKGDKKPKKTVAEPEKDVQESPVAKNKQDEKPLPGWLARRQDKIKAEQAALANGGNVNTVQYGENAPGFLKRRFGGEK
jgi:hypothetical protein